jgi:hypothetical protein
MIVTDIQCGPGLKTQEYSAVRPSQSGAVYWNADMQKFTLFNGQYFNDFYPQRPFVEFDQYTKETIEWARKKMEEETAIKAKIESSEAIREAYNHFQTLLALTK